MTRRSHGPREADIHGRWRRRLCWTQKAGAVRKIKRQGNRRERREGRRQARRSEQ